MITFLVFSFIFIFGLVFASWYGRKTKKFRWSEYVLLIIFPVLALIWLSKIFGVIIWNIYLVSMLAGEMLEYFVGWAYHKTEGKRLWEYKRASISGYTSWLSLPFWGIAGILFFLLAKAFGA